MSKIGTYFLVYSATDSSGNSSASTKTVKVVDNQQPIIELLGDNPLQHEVNTDFVDPGAEARDNSGLSLYVQSTGNVDIAQLGRYFITYNTKDASGNEAVSVQREVNVMDTTSPEILVLGETSILHEINTPYIDAGAAVQDNFDDTYKIYSEGVVDVTNSGVYTITYSAKDTENNESESKTRTVTVVDTLPPTFAIKGDSELYHEVGTVYVDAGVKLVEDNSNKQVVLQTLYYDENNNLIDDIFKLGLSLSTFKIEYTATDAADLSGNTRKTTKTRVVHVVDTVPPIITIDAPMVTVPLDLQGVYDYENHDVSVVDASGEQLSVTWSGEVDMSKTGTYFLVYSATDSSGNNSQATKTVKVVDGVNPIIQVDPLTIDHEINTAYQDIGITATDNSGLSLYVQSTGTVDVSELGEYKITYNAKDASGNEAQPVIRTVNIVDTISPEIIVNGDSVVYHLLNSEYNDLGASVKDNSNYIDASGNLVDRVTLEVDSNVDITSEGDYTITYTATDNEGQGNSTQTSRTVYVRNDVSPIIVLEGESVLEIERTHTYTEQGAKAYNNDGEELDVSVSGSVDTNTVGVYNITYESTDPVLGITDTKTRVVTIVDQTSPNFTVQYNSNNVMNYYYVMDYTTNEDISIQVYDNSETKNDISSLFYIDEGKALIAFRNKQDNEIYYELDIVASDLSENETSSKVNFKNSFYLDNLTNADTSLHLNDTLAVKYKGNFIENVIPFEDQSMMTFQWFVLNENNEETILLNETKYYFTPTDPNLLSHKIGVKVGTINNELKRVVFDTNIDMAPNVKVEGDLQQYKTLTASVDNLSSEAFLSSTPLSYEWYYLDVNQNMNLDDKSYIDTSGTERTATSEINELLLQQKHVNNLQNLLLK